MTPSMARWAQRRIGGVEAAKAFAIQNRIDILYCALPGTRQGGHHRPDGIL